MDALEAKSLEFAEDLFQHLLEISPVFWSLPPGNVERTYTSGYDTVLGKCAMRLWYEIQSDVELHMRNESMKFVQSKKHFENYLRETARRAISCAKNVYEQIFGIAATLLAVISFLYRRGMPDFIKIAPRGWTIMMDFVDFEELRKVGGLPAVNIAARLSAEDYDKNKCSLLAKYWAKSCELLVGSLKSAEISEMSSGSAEVSCSEVTRMSPNETRAELPGIGKEVSSSESNEISPSETSTELTATGKEVSSSESNEISSSETSTELTTTGKEVSSSESNEISPHETNSELFDAKKDIVKDAQRYTAADPIATRTAAKAIGDSPSEYLACDPELARDIPKTEENPIAEDIVVEKSSEQSFVKSSNLEKTGVDEAQEKAEDSDECEKPREGYADESLRESIDPKSESSASGEIHDGKIERPMEVKKDCPPPQSSEKSENSEKLIKTDVDHKSPLTLEISQAGNTSETQQPTDVRTRYEAEVDRQEPANVKQSNVRQTHKNKAKLAASKMVQPHSSEKQRKRVSLDSKTPKKVLPDAGSRSKSANKSTISSTLLPSGKDQTSKRITSTSKIAPLKLKSSMPTVKFNTFFVKTISTEKPETARRLSLPKDLPKPSSEKVQFTWTGRVLKPDAIPKRNTPHSTSLALASSQRAPKLREPSQQSTSGSSAARSLAPSTVDKAGTKKAETASCKETSDKQTSISSKMIATSESASRVRHNQGRTAPKDVKDPKKEKPRWK